MARAIWAYDPNGRHEFRYHDGIRFTDHVSDEGVASIDPYDPDHKPEALASYRVCEYLGGHSGIAAPQAGGLFISRDAIGIGDLTHGKARIPATDIERVEVLGGEVAVSKLVNVLAFGVLGFASKGKKHQTALIIHTKDDEAAYYLIDRAEPIRVRVEMVTVCNVWGVTLEPVT